MDLLKQCQQWFEQDEAQKIIESNSNRKSSPEGELLLYPSFAARTERVILGFTCAVSR